MQPGDTITPGASAPPPAGEPPEIDSRQPEPAAAQPNETVSSTQSVFPAQQAYSPEESQGQVPPTPIMEPAPNMTSVSTGNGIQWTASEYMAHQKNASWFALLAFATIIGCLLVYILTNGDLVSTTVIAIVAVTFGVAAAKQPRTLQYALDGRGIHIAEKFYPYGGFKSFSIVDEDAMSSIWLMPLKRFMPPLTIYYPPEDEDRIAEVLAQYLPYEDRDRDMVDRFMHKIRF